MLDSNDESENSIKIRRSSYKFLKPVTSKEIMNVVENEVLTFCKKQKSQRQIFDFQGRVDY